MNRLRPVITAFLVGCGVATAILTSSCSGDDPVYTPGESIAIVSNDLLFPAEGTTATVQVTAAAPIAATLTADWCRAAVSGNTVTVTADPNTHFEGRTALLTITAGTARRQLPVQQLGMVLDLPMVTTGHYSPAAGDVFTTTIVHTLPMTVSASHSWIHPVIDGNTLQVTVDSNVGGHIRRGQVFCECAGYADTLSIAQYDMQNDVVGSYYMMGYYGGSGQPAATRFDLIMRHDSLLMHWPQERYADAYIHIPVDKPACTLFIPSGFTLYSDARTSVNGYFYDTNGTVATASGAGVTARLAYSESSGYNSAALVAANWPGHSLGGFLIRNTSIVSTTLLQLGSPVLMRVGPVGTVLGEDGAARLKVNNELSSEGDNNEAE